MVTYNSAYKYIESATTTKGRIVCINQILDALYATALSAAADDNINEYWLDDGQIKIRTNYKGVHAIENSIKQFEKLRQMYLQRVNGRVFRAMDSKNFPNGC